MPTRNGAKETILFFTDKDIFTKSNQAVIVTAFLLTIFCGIYSAITPLRDFQNPSEVLSSEKVARLVKSLAKARSLTNRAPRNFYCPQRCYRSINYMRFIRLQRSDLDSAKRSDLDVCKPLKNKTFSGIDRGGINLV